MNKIVSLENYRKKRDGVVFAAVNGAYYCIKFKVGKRVVTVDANVPIVSSVDTSVADFSLVHEIYNGRK